MSFEKIKENIYYCGEKDSERRLFDQLVPLPEGTTYNSYLIKGSDKVALIDSTYPPKIENFIKTLKENGINKIDYFISNHGEQDHSGAYPRLLEEYPEAKIVTNPKCKDSIVNMLNVDESKITVIADKEELSLGDKTLQFIFTPFVHWPDTMFTYLKEDNMLFTCDYLGAHYTSGGIYADNSKNLETAAKRYFAEIMMPFRSFANKYLGWIREMNPSMILPSHGPVYKEPQFILDLYEKWTGPILDNTVLIPYVSMYESTEKMVKYLAKKLEEKDIKAILFDTVDEDHGELAMTSVMVATIVLAAPMVLAGPHPSMITTSYLLSIIKPKFKNLAIVGSFGWGGKLVEPLENMFSLTKPNRLTDVLVKGFPKSCDCTKLDALADEIYQSHKELGLIK